MGDSRMTDTCVILSGRIKSWKDSYHCFINSLSNFDYDVFCSLNTDFDDIDAFEFSKMPFVKEVACLQTPYPEVLNLVNQNVIVAHRKNIYSANFHRYSAFLNSMKYKKYKRYVFYRADILSENFLPKFELQEKTLYCPKKFRFGMRDSEEIKLLEDEEILNDQIMICDYAVASVIVDTLVNIFDLYTRNIPFHPETLLMNQCTDYGINFDYFDFDYELNPNRHL
jgi:hypothetical protein